MWFNERLMKVPYWALLRSVSSVREVLLIGANRTYARAGATADFDPQPTCAWFSRSGSRYVLRVRDAAPWVRLLICGERATADEVIE